MLLAVDIGNTNIVMGCIRLPDGKILMKERLSTDHNKTSLEYAMSVKNAMLMNNMGPEQVTGVAIASVVPPITALFADAMRRLTNCEPVIVGPGIRTDLKLQMDNPAQIGADLIVGAVAGLAQYPAPLVLIDMGTATTICVLDEEKNYIGGMILPGLRVSLDSLTNRTSQLPRISLDPPKVLIGKNTVDCMRSGILYGNASCIDGMIDRIREELGQELTVVATGGLAGTIVSLCKNKIILDDELLLKGLLEIYRMNR